MRRRSSPLMALCSAALMFGTLLGVATNLPRVQIKSAHAREPPAAKDAAPEKETGKGAAGATCKVTRDCQEGLVCLKAGDHKECTAAPTNVRKVPVLT